MVKTLKIVMVGGIQQYPRDTIIPAGTIIDLPNQTAANIIASLAAEPIDEPANDNEPGESEPKPSPRRARR